MKKFLAIFFIAGLISAQTRDPNKILDQVKRTFDSVHDYQADIEIKVDINYLKTPDTKAKIYFKQPDKVKFESKGFAMLPRQSLNFSPSHLLKGDFTSIYVKADTLDGSQVDVIKIIPNSDSSGVVLSTLWIDRGRHIVRKIETTGKGGGTVFTLLKYDGNSVLPASLKFTFESSMSETQRMALQKQDGTVRPDRNLSNLQGSVTIIYSNYQINKGLPDSIFAETKK